MQNKNLLIALVIGAVVILGLGWKVLSGSSISTGSGNEPVSLTTNPNPLQMGPATFIIDVKDKDGKPVDNATVYFDLNMTAMNMGAQQGNATSQGNGRYAASGQMSMRGPWKVTTKITMPDGSVVNKDFTVNVP
ncbi:MAG: hypothetical protein UT39_C0014G0013 [Candidatus Woesebacteria bacterium GW2011_GWA1_39_21]|uniref:YtkA-like domain-containing protein n=1 Tax=Candidatus Woesebacteria bacterium GW2011_GWA1_39_21 TaxID=1618550 RepID=A0A0G0N3N2_9BACT|nr:MAG: hypothetical protein UT39_C0014G0013 [Candidatus Woesebacteria bacterium GW2011_GWA1_39_21]